MSASEDLGASPIQRLDDMPRILREMRAAVREALIEHKRAGNHVCEWRDGSVRWIPPEEIPLLSPPDDAR